MLKEKHLSDKSTEEELKMSEKQITFNVKILDRAYSGGTVQMSWNATGKELLDFILEKSNMKVSQ